MEYVHYKTTLKTIAKGIVLKEHDHVPSTGAEGMLVECVDAAPFEEQPYADREKWDPSGMTTGISTEKAYQHHKSILSDLREDRLHIIDGRDIVRRYEE